MRRSIFLAGCFGVAGFVALLGPPRIEAQTPDFLFVLGAGNSGLWVTEFTVSNTTDEEQTIIASLAPEQPCPPLASCLTSVILPPRGTEVIGAPNTGVAGIYVGSLDGSRAPAVQARAHTSSGPAMSVDLPVFDVDFLRANAPSTLSFAGAQRNSGGRSNLIVANVADPNRIGDESVTLLLQAFGADGVLIGETTLTLEHGESKFIGDVIGVLGVAELSAGQVRLTKKSGLGVFWAIMSILRPDGTSSVALGTAF
jgi:hypothetical protein